MSVFMDMPPKGLSEDESSCSVSFEVSSSFASGLGAPTNRGLENVRNETVLEGFCITVVTVVWGRDDAPLLMAVLSLAGLSVLDFLLKTGLSSPSFPAENMARRKKVKKVAQHDHSSSVRRISFAFSVTSS